MKTIYIIIATTSGPPKSGVNREVVSLQRSESIIQALLGHDQVVLLFILERQSLDTSGRLHCIIFLRSTYTFIGERSELSSVADGDFVYIYVGTFTLDTRVWLTSETT